jgi:uncharacterized protein
MPRREEKRRKEETGKMTVEEAGKKGGETTKGTHGHEFYQEIGKKGGEERSREIREEGVSLETHEKLSEAGRKGGEATKESHGREFYQEIGKKGGEERAREIREVGVSPETHEKLSEAGHKGGEITKETHGREFYQEIGKKGGAAPKGATRGEVQEGEVIVRLSGTDLDIMFSSQEEAEEWRNRFASMMEQEGYHLSRVKPEAMAGAEAEASSNE